MTIARLAAALLLTSASLARAHDGDLPLGDGKISPAPTRGYVYSCQQRFNPNAPGAFRTGPWIKGDHWTRDGKPQVEGKVTWPNSQISVTREGDKRVVRANNLPDHATGEFPIRPGTEAYQYDRNPNHIGAQEILLTLPAEPQAAAQPSCVPMGMIGFAVSGVAIFNALDARGDDAPAHEIQDLCNGHPERTAQYHYHSWSPCLEKDNKDKDAPVGWMLDGFPILGPVDAKGKEYTDADLDACHGIVGPVDIDGQRVVTYHYRFTDEYPYTIGCFRGTPIATRFTGMPGRQNRDQVDTALTRSTGY
jgi:hypothetical protein